MAPLMLGALGVVFGDIGTSPLYTLRECFQAAGLALTPDTVLGVLSMVTWALLLVVTLKYVAIVLRADNRGEGGILALTALATTQLAHPRARAAALSIGLGGTALFYADSLITPAISVLGAMEGLSVAAPSLQPIIIPCALGLLVGLFALQKQGSGAMGAWFGPVMLVWFSVLGLLGFAQLVEAPSVLAALNPLHAAAFAFHNPGITVITMGAVVLAVTGAEALYADMGHFGRRPIQYVWLYFVGPCLLLNYYGQGALLLDQPLALANPFYLMAPDALRFPLVILAAAATVIASQAVISGAFSLTQQAIQLGYLPRMDIRHTSAQHAGQIYLPTLNWLMCIAVVALVLSFGSSSALAHAYGLAVTGAMMAVTLLLPVVFVRVKNWPLAAILPVVALFLFIEAGFLAATFMKLLEGGWFPLLLGAFLFLLMWSWIVGRDATHRLTAHQTPHLDYFLKHLDPSLPRTDRTAIYMTSDLNHMPPALMYNLHHNGVWHAQTILIKIARARVPRYPMSERIRVTHHAHGLSTVHAMFGFLETPHVPHLVADLADHGLRIQFPDKMTYVVSTHTYVASPRRVLNRAQEALFIVMDKFQQSATSYFRIPRGKVIEIGNQIEI